ncbi:MAG: DUF4419 domain-containing protein [Rhodocyclaceae bacterium]|nr:DUF4419 domain-containing protein [Rhodocyclaceae bacterium]
MAAPAPTPAAATDGKVSTASTAAAHARRRFTFAGVSAAAAAKERSGELSGDEDWISAVPNRTVVYIRRSLSFDASAAACTHAGFIHYLHACWAAERGVVLRPDVIWHTVLCEMARIIQAAPMHYRHLFTDDGSGTKRELEVLTAAPSAMDARVLAEVSGTAHSHLQFHQCTPRGWCSHPLRKSRRR